MTVETHYPIAENDPTHYVLVSANDNRKLSENFLYREFYNSKVGAAEHPIARNVVDCVQAIRSHFQIPIRITSSYRNYVPLNGINPASISPHMLAQALDFQFISSDKALLDSLYIQIREDFDQEGPLFQKLWNLGARGFGSYDTFIHLDTVTTDLYEVFKNKRTRNWYEGEYYGRWNNMKRLLYRKAPYEVDGVNVSENEERGGVVENYVRGVAGLIEGSYNELSNSEDRGKDFDIFSIGYLLAILVLLFAIIWGVSRLWR